MRTVYRSLLVLGVVCLLAQALLAQEGGGQGRGRGRGFGGGMGGGPLGLLQNESVQKELNLTSDQVSKVKDVAKEIGDKHQEEFAALRDLSREERQEKGRALRKTIHEEAKKSLAGVLKPEQEKRLHQIELQQMHARAFSDPDVQAALKLSDDQKDKLKTINDDAQKEMESMFPGRRGGAGGGGGQQGGNREENRKKMQTLQKETMDKSLAVLNDQQKKEWSDMLGTPFEVQRPQRPDRP
jgi:hypothetical protein